jgi:hypothetical protein
MVLEWQKSHFFGESRAIASASHHRLSFSADFYPYFFGWYAMENLVKSLQRNNPTDS